MPLQRLLRFRYSLRALLVFITLFALWGGYHANRGWKQRHSEQILLATREASILYRDRWNRRNPLQAVAATYAWVVDKLWGDRIVKSVSVKSDLPPDVAQAIGSFGHLESIELFAPQMGGSNWRIVAVPSEALEQSLAQRTVKDLYMRGYALSDADCQAIAGGQSIEQLNLVRVRLSNQGLARLLAAPRIRHVSIGSSEITDREFPAHAGSPTLEWISIGAPISNNFGSFAARCPKLTSLGVKGESVDDRFVMALGGHSALEMLGLGSTSVSDQSVAIIAQMPSLKAVALPRDTVSQQAINNLQAARPDLRINYVSSDAE